MKRIIITICVITIIFLFCMTVCAKGKMYPHPDVKTEITTNEGEQKASSGRVWKTIYGEVTREDMEHGELRYTVYLPENYDSNKEYPFLLYLHGGELGYFRTVGATPWSKDLGGSAKYAESIANSIEDCIIFAPQAPGAPNAIKDRNNAYWSEVPTGGIVQRITEDKSASSPYLRAVEKMMEDYLEKGISYGDNVYTVDASRLYLAGHSMGAIGSYTILRDCPDVFAAAVIGAGIGDPDSVDLWKSTPVRICHGTKDTTIPYKSTEVMAEALKNYPNVEIVTLDNGDHNIKPFIYGANWDGSANENFAWMATKDRDTNVIKGASSKHTLLKYALDIPEDTGFKVVLDGEEITFPDQQPFSNTAVKMPGGSKFNASDNRGMFIPLRAVSEAAGFDVSWDGETQTVTVKKGNRVATFKLGGDCLVNGVNKPCYFNFPLKGDRVFVSVYGICHALDCSMRWDDVNRVIYFYSKEKYPLGSDLTQGGYTGANTDSAKYQQFYSIAEKAFNTPGVQEDFVPGGIAYRKATNQFYITGYFNTDRSAVIATIDASTGKIVSQLRLLEKDGSIYQGKPNGIAVSEKDIYISSNSDIQRISLEKADNSIDGCVKIEESINLTLGQSCVNSFVEVKDGYLWTGNYYKPDDKNYAAKAHENYGFLLKGYKLDPDTGRLAENKKAESSSYIPDILYSLEKADAIQGMTISENNIFTVSSYSNGLSTVQLYDKTKAIDNGEIISIGEVSVPVKYLNCEKKLVAMPYAEEITEADGNLYTIFKSASISLRKADNVTATDQVWKLDTKKIIISEKKIIISE